MSQHGCTFAIAHQRTTSGVCPHLQPCVRQSLAVVRLAGLCEGDYPGFFPVSMCRCAGITGVSALILSWFYVCSGNLKSGHQTCTTYLAIFLAPHLFLLLGPRVPNQANLGDPQTPGVCLFLWSWDYECIAIPNSLFRQAMGPNSGLLACTGMFPN